MMQVLTRNSNCQDRTHGEAVAPIVIVPVPVIAIRVQVPCIAVTCRRSRPHVQVLPYVIDSSARTILAVASGRKEQ